VVTDGVTGVVGPKNPIGLQKYDMPPLAVNVTVEPAQMLVPVDEAVMVGCGLTTRLTVDEPIQPKALVLWTV
jgi:hypothetical protein